MECTRSVFRLSGLVGLSVFIFACGARQSDLQDPGSPDDWADGFSIDDGVGNTGNYGDADGAREKTDAFIVRKESLDKVLDEGIGRFLGRLEVEPKLSARQRFVGWQIVRFNSPDRLGKALRPGDVVVAVNQQQIERPGQVAELWDNLRKARVIQIDVLRDGAPVSLSYAVVK